MKKRTKKLVIIGVIVLAIILLLSLVDFFTDWLWFAELGYVSVFFTKLFTKLGYGVPLFILITLGCYAYLHAMKKNYYAKIGGYEMLASEKKVNGIAWIISGAFGLLASVMVVNKLWFQILQFVHSTDFNILDPIFSKDVSFYIFKLEFITEINNILITLIVCFAIANIIYYLALFSTRKPDFFKEMEATYEQPQEEEQPRGQQANPFGDGLFGQMFGGNMRNQQGPLLQRTRPSRINKNTLSRLLDIAGRQFKVLGVLFFLMVALHYYLKQFTLLYTSSSGVVYGAGFTDINVKLWAYRLLLVLAIAAAVMFVVGLNKKRLKTIIMIPVIMIGVSLLGGGIALLVQNLIVAPDELSKEYPYLENNIEFTRYAYGLQDIEVREFAATNSLSAADIQNNMETISNIRINDYEPALKFYNQTQSIRLYYNFTDVDVDRYMVNGEYTQVFLSARELDETATTDQWLSNHLKYTHGYGITLSRVDKVTDSGQPDMLIDSIPPVSDVEEIQVTNPAIYFGEGTEAYIIVNTDETEFDYPSDEGNVYTEYSGNAGIRMNFINRLLFSIRESSIKLLVSSNIDSNSRIIINRDIMTRVKTIAPFLVYDSDPYVVTMDGGLYWIIDAYTTSSYYPYSEPFNTSTSVNYIRNSVKVVIDAYNGDTDFYIVDETDPIAITLQKIYPKLFKSIDELSEDMQAHLRYPNTMFEVQANVYTKYHMTDVAMFYQNEDAWDIANEIYGTEEAQMTPTYYILKVPGAQNAEFVSSVPYTPSGKDNMTAILMARSDGDNYGQLILFQMPKDRIIYGPRQIEARINQHTKIAQDFTLWSSAGSTYSRGNMFVIPIENSLIYVEPIYLESANSSLPEVKRVIIYYNERIAYEDTLAKALDSMFGEGASSGYADADETDGEGGDPSALSLEQLAQLANTAFDNALEAQQNGDWAAYGRYLDELASYLELMVPSAAETTAAPVDDTVVEDVLPE